MGLIIAILLIAAAALVALALSALYTTNRKTTARIENIARVNGRLQQTLYEISKTSADTDSRLLAEAALDAVERDTNRNEGNY